MNIFFSIDFRRKFNIAKVPAYSVGFASEITYILFFSIIFISKNSE